MIFSSFDRPSWRVLGKHWPNHEASRFVEAGGMRWHIQEMGQGPTVLLLHGTGAATHSWRGLMPRLAERFHVVAPDLPAHGFSDGPPFLRLSLPRIARVTAALVEELGIEPALAVGHSAGAATLMRMMLDKAIRPLGLVSLNGAFLPFEGMAGHIFPPLAKLLFVNPLAPRLFAMGGYDRTRVARLIHSTGSMLDDDGLRLYQLLLTTPGHVSGTLAMMANWDLEPLNRDMHKLAQPVLLVSGLNDRAVPPRVAHEVARYVKAAEVLDLPRLGHLAHEEDPGQVARIIAEFADKVGVSAAA